MDATPGQEQTPPKDNDAPDPQPLAPYEQPWNHPWQPPFLRALSLIPDVSSACRVANIGRARAYEVRGKDPVFRAAWDESLERAQDTLVSTAFRFATSGLPVRRQVKKTSRRTKEGVIIDETTETVETEAAERYGPMLIFLLKAHFPDRYRWSERIETTGAEGGPIRFESITELDQKIAALHEELRVRAGSDPVPVEDAQGVPDGE